MNLNGSSAEEQDLPRKSLHKAEAIGFDLGLKPWIRSIWEHLGVSGGFQL